VKEQRLRTKKVNAKKVNTAKTQADRACGRVYNLLESEFPVIIVKNDAVQAASYFVLCRPKNFGRH
jgi:hypothetical protein